MPYDQSKVDALMPLPPATFHILLALAKEDKHGYAVIQDVEEARKGVVAHQVPGIGFLGRRQRQRALRPEQAEKFHDQLEPAVANDGALEVGRRELEIGILPEIDIFLAPRRALADPGALRVRALELAQHMVEIEAPGLGGELLEQRHSPLRMPMRGGHRMISPRSVEEITVCVK